MKPGRLWSRFPVFTAPEGGGLPETTQSSTESPSDNTGEPPAEPGVKTAGATVIELLAAQLGHLLNVKTSLETRGTAVIWTSASLVTLLLAVTTVNWSTAGAASTLVSWQFALAAISFVVAVACGLIATWPNEYGWINLEKDKGMAQILRSPGVMQAASVYIERKIALEIFSQMEAARNSNRHKAQALKTGISAEAAAVLLLAERVVEMVIDLWSKRG